VTREELIARLEAATGPSRELDAQIAITCGKAPAVAFRPCVSLDPGTFGIGAYEIWVAPSYTASIDAALTLVPEGWAIERLSHWPDIGASVELWEVTYRNGKPWHTSRDRKVEVRDVATPAIALCIAALRARGDA